MTKKFDLIILIVLQASPSWTSENGDCFFPYEEQCKVLSQPVITKTFKAIVKTTIIESINLETEGDLLPFLDP